MICLYLADVSLDIASVDCLVEYVQSQAEGVSEHVLTQVLHHARDTCAFAIY